MQILRQNSDDCAYTYTSGNFFHMPHVRRLKEFSKIVVTYTSNTVEEIIDIGGNSGFLGDYLSNYLLSLKFQSIYDIIHPGNETNPNRIFYQPKLKTFYNTFDLNKDNLNVIKTSEKTLVICSETLEHIKDPIESSKKIIDKILSENSQLYLSFPIETGFIGVLKFFQRLLIGRYYKNKRSFISLTNQLLWLLGFKNKYRKIQSIYTDHDGFNDRELTKFIIKYSANQNCFQYFKKGFSTIHIFLRKSNS